MPSFPRFGPGFGAAGGRRRLALRLPALMPLARMLLATMLPLLALPAPASPALPTAADAAGPARPATLVADTVRVQDVPAEELSRAARPPLAEQPDAGGTARRARPRVGLALGGGGARGFAHIGVLKALERLRVPVDCVAGASMGAVVGGLHALGLPAADIEREVLAVDWQAVFSDKPRRADRSFRRKQDDYADLFDFELGIAHGDLVLPRGLIAGQKFAFALPFPELYVPRPGGFDELPVPFRAVASDLRTGEAVALKGGDLVRAIRASLAVPGVFPPVEIDGRLLVDGGFTLNLPVDVARSMGADVVIAVDVNRELAEAKDEELGSLTGITRQVSVLVVRQNMRDQLARAQAVVKPPLDDMTSTSFGRAAFAVRRGEEAALAAAAALAPYALSEEEYREFQAARRRQPPGPIRVNEVEIANASRLDDRAVRSRLTVRPTASLDLRRLERDVGRVWELGLFELVNFELREREGRNVLRVIAREKGYAPSTLNFGLAFRDDLAGDSRFDLRARWTVHALNTLGAELRLDGQVGSAPGLAAEYYQPLDFAQMTFLSLRGELGSRLRAVYAGETQVAEHRVYHEILRGDLGRQFGNIAELRAGIVWGDLRSKHRIGELGPGDLSGRLGGWTARLALDTLDDVGFPRRGAAFALQHYRADAGLGAPFAYDRLRGALGGYATSGLNTVFAGLAAGSDLHTGLPDFDRFRLGGLLSFSGYREERLAGRAFGVARLGYFRAITPHLGQLRPRYYVGLWGEAGDAWPTARAASLRDLRRSGTLALAARTPLGPICLAYGRAWDAAGRAEEVWYLTVGRRLGSLEGE